MRGWRADGQAILVPQGGPCATLRTRACSGPTQNLELTEKPPGGGGNQAVSETAASWGESGGSRWSILVNDGAAQNVPCEFASFQMEFDGHFQTLSHLESKKRTNGRSRSTGHAAGRSSASNPLWYVQRVGLRSRRLAWRDRG